LSAVAGSKDNHQSHIPWPGRVKKLDHKLLLCLPNTTNKLPSQYVGTWHLKKVALFFYFFYRQQFLNSTEFSATGSVVFVLEPLHIWNVENRF
jgi:hypothetical protein